MKNIIKRIVITIVISINLICISFAQWWWAMWHWPEGDWWYEWSLLWGPRNNWWMWLWNEQFIFNTEIDKIVDTTFWWEYDGSGNPTRIWTYRISWEWTIEWLVWTSDIIDNYETALTKVLHVIQNVVNYTLWILGLIALIYIMIHWFIILTAAGDDTKAKKWYKWIKNAFIAIAWIGLSWLIISWIIRLINTVAT